MTRDDAEKYQEDHRVYDLDREERAMKRAKRHKIADGFQAGYQPGLGEYVGGPREYAQKCRAKGLVETGREPMVQKEKKTQYLTDDIAKGLSSEGVSDSVIDSLKD